MSKATKKMKNEQQVVEFDDFQCRNCGHRKCSLTNVYPTTHYSGEDASGKPFTRTDRFRVTCDECEQPQVILRHV